jgi:plastocyanin
MTARPIILSLALMVATGCGGGGGGGTGPTPVFTSLAISPSAPSVVIGGTVQLTATPKDQNGNAMSGLPSASFTSSDETKATVNASTGLVTGVAAGAATITATLTSGTITKSTQTVVTVRAIPASADVTATTGNSFDPSVVDITQGGSVTWTFQATIHNVTFNSPPAAVANIGDTSNGSESRTFKTAGTYDYHCTRHAGMTGKVIVH